MTFMERQLISLLEECIEAESQGFWDLHDHETDEAGDMHYTISRSQVARDLLDHSKEMRERLDALVGVGEATK